MGQEMYADGALGNQRQGMLKKTWWDCIRGDMDSFGLFCEDAQDRYQWRLRVRGNQLTQVYMENGQ